LATTNTNADTSYRAKWFAANLQQTLKAALVAEKICAVDNTDVKYIWNPYGNAPTTVIQAIVGSYVPATYASTLDTLTVADEFIVSEHIHDFESVMQNGDIYASRLEELTASVKTAIDAYVINGLCEEGTGTYSTPTGGFTTAANVSVIMSNLLSKVAGYADTYKGLYLVIEATDVPGFIQAGASQGFSFADAWLNNGWMTSYMGVDIYVVPSGTFTDTAKGSRTDTNSGHRVFGVKGIATYASPRGVRYEEKSIGAETGKEVVVWGYCGFRAWIAKRALTVDITLA